MPQPPSRRLVTEEALDTRQGAPGGLAPLGDDQKVPDSNLPERLSDAGLNAAIAAQIAASVGTSLAAVTASIEAPTRSFGVQILGDSTGNAADEWVYEVAQAIAAEEPALTVHHRVWNDATQDYSAPTVIQTGTAGVLAMPCTAAKQTRRLPASMSPHISGILDVRVKMSLTDWTPAAQHVFTGKTDAAGTRGWWAGINNTASGNRPFFTFSTDGTALTTTTVIGTPTVADGDTLWMRWVFNPNDGAGNRTLAAYQSPDGVTWTQIGATVTTAGTVALFDNSTVGYALGGEGSGTNATGATIYEVQIRDGLNGPSVVPLLPDLWPPNAVSTANTVAVTGAPILTFVNGSHPGANLAYWSDPTRIKVATPPLGQKATFISLSHNQGASFGADFLGSYESLRGAVEARLPGAPTVVVVQNPQKPGEVGAAQHAQRRLDLIGHARQKGLGLIDIYKAFLAYGDWSADLMADGIHPNAAGEDLWRDTVLAAFGITST